MKYFKRQPKTEAELEKGTLKLLREAGALCYKFVSPNKRGVPDDIILLGGGLVIFAEFKNPNGTGRLSKLQEINIEKLRRFNYIVYVVDSVESAERLIDDCKGVLKHA